MSVITSKKALKEVLECQVSLEGVNTDKVNMKEAILLQQQKLDSAEVCKKKLALLMEKRRGLLADAALGNGNNIELAALNAEIEVNKANTVDSDLLIVAETIAGLTAKLNAVSTVQEELQRKKSALIATLLLAEAEELGAVYIEDMNRLAATHRQLLVNNALLKQAGGAGIVPESSVRIDVPLFRLEAHKGLEIGDIPGKVRINSQAQYSDTLISAEIAESKQRLNQWGVCW